MEVAHVSHWTVAHRDNGRVPQMYTVSATDRVTYGNHADAVANVPHLIENILKDVGEQWMAEFSSKNLPAVNILACSHSITNDGPDLKISVVVIFTLSP